MRRTLKDGTQVEIVKVIMEGYLEVFIDANNIAYLEEDFI